jgi:predicted Zn-dependent protease
MTSLALAALPAQAQRRAEVEQQDGSGQVGASRQQSRQAQAITASDRQQGAAANPDLTAQYGGAYVGPQTAMVTRVGKRVALQSGISDTASDFTVTTLNSPVENAFATPGGYIYVTRQLLALMNSEAELAAVLGHEVGHVAARHACGSKTRSTIGSILATGAGVVTGSDVATRVVGAGAQLYTLGYGRGQEYEADALGVRYINAAGYDPFAAADILDSLEQSTELSAQAAGTAERSVPSWASTHPNGAERVRRAYELAEQTGHTNVSPAQDTAFLRMLDGLPYGAVADRKVVCAVTVRPRDTVASLSTRMAFDDLREERFRVLNGLSDDETLKPGMLVKIVARR